MDLSTMISALRSERDRIDETIRFMGRPDRRSTRTARTPPSSITEIRSISKPNTTTISARNRIERAIVSLERSERMTDPPARRVVEIRRAKEPDDAA